MSQRVSALTEPIASSEAALVGTDDVWRVALDGRAARE